MSQEQSKEMSQGFYRASAADFMKIPGSPVAYWVSPDLCRNFLSPRKIGNAAKKGLSCSGTETFYRLFWEISKNKASVFGGSKWYPITKGGPFRKWFGNNEFLINWEDNGSEIKSRLDGSGRPVAAIRNEASFFLECSSWNDVSSGVLSCRFTPKGSIPTDSGPAIYSSEHKQALAFLNSAVAMPFAKLLCPTIHFGVGQIAEFPLIVNPAEEALANSELLVGITRRDWDSYEVSPDFSVAPIIGIPKQTVEDAYNQLRLKWGQAVEQAKSLEEENNRIFIDAYGLQDELTPEVQLNEITLTCNPHYRYGGDKSEAELEILQQCDTIKELVSYAIGCMMGRYSLDKPGLILASQGETLQDYLRHIPSPRFAPDDDAILPLTYKEWFSVDATHRFCGFIRFVWGEEHLQQNLNFVAESLCLNAIKPKKGESSLDTIRRYLSTQFFKDHLRTYKKRPIYWLFSSGKHKAFECLVYLHRYNEGTLARMRTEYVIPLTAKLNTYANKLEQDLEASTSTAEKKALEKQLAILHNQQAELATFDEKLRHYADQRISLDLDDGVKVSYGKFGDLLAEVKAVTGDKSSDA